MKRIMSVCFAVAAIVGVGTAHKRAIKRAYMLGMVDGWNASTLDDLFDEYELSEDIRLS